MSWMLSAPHPTCQTKSFFLPGGTNRPQSLHPEDTEIDLELSTFSPIPLMTPNSASANMAGNISMELYVGHDRKDLKNSRMHVRATETGRIKLAQNPTPRKEANCLQAQ